MKKKKVKKEIKTKTRTRTSKPTLKVTIASPHNETYFTRVYRADQTSLDIVNSSIDSAVVSGVTPSQSQQLTESVDFAKTYKPYISRIKVALDFKNGFQFEVERLPSKVVRTKK